MRGRKPNFVACVYCRQMKLACDGSSKFPNGCSRCTKAGKFCSVDPSYKRERKRQQLDQVEQELQRVQNAVNGPGQQQLERDTLIESRSRTALGKTAANFLQATSHNLISTELIDQVEFPESMSIGGVELSRVVIHDLVKEWYQFYNPYLIFTAMRDKAEYRHLFLSLVDEIYNMAFDCIRPRRASFHSMQALLLLCHWHPPFVTLSNDPSNAFINMATHIGLRLGLHRPEYTREFDPKIYIDEDMQILRRITWVVCFITNVSVNLQMGLPPNVKLDRGLIDILNNKPVWLPDTLYCQLCISRQKLNICMTLGTCESSNTGLLPNAEPVIKLFEEELRALEATLSVSWSKPDYLGFCACKTALYILALSASDNTEDGDWTTTETRSHWVLQVFMASIAIVQTTSSVQDQFLKKPTRLFQILAGAVSFLLLLKCSKYHNLVDNGTLSRGIRQGCDLLRGTSITPHDFANRVYSAFQRLSIYSETLKPEDKTEDVLSAKTRMGYNVVRSTVLLLRTKAQNQTRDSDTTPNNHIESHSIENFNVEDMSSFLDFEWDDSFLYLLPQIV